MDSAFQADRQLPRGTALQGRGSRRGAGSRTLQRGFTLVEMLVVLLILGLATLVVVTNLATVYQRSELDGAVNELTAFLGSVPRVATERHSPVFLVWDAAARTFTIALDAAATQPVRQFHVPDAVSATVNPEQVLRCDTLGRAFPGSSTSMLDTLQTVQVVRSGSASGVSYVVRLSPLWAVIVEKRVT